MTLQEYRQKRRFQDTPEPAGEYSESTSEQRADRPARFAIHKHDATRLHFDLRLEYADVLKCWAVPRGPSVDPGQRRLAVQTEDHPLKYLDFEGLIPAGSYGAGPMILWDRGHWTCRKPVDQALREGKLKISLDGQRLRGRWTLVRTGGPQSKQWLLIREKRDPAIAKSTPSGSEPVVTERASVVSGKTVHPGYRG